MLGTSVRRGLAALGTTIIAATATLAVTAAPAHAAPTGKLLAKGVAGTVYSHSAYVTQGVVPGGTPATFFVKIVNTSTMAEQFKVTVAPTPGAVTTLYEGSLARKSPYYTPPIAPGGSLVLSLKVSLPGGAAVAEYAPSVFLRDPETDATLDAFDAVAFATYQTGTTRNDLFLRTGTQPYVGGSNGITAHESANALKVGNTATYMLRLKNNGSTTSTITLAGLPLDACGGALTVTVKLGTKNVTAAVMGGTYSTSALAPGGRKDLKVFAKLVRHPAAPCTSDAIYFRASGPDGNSAQVLAQVLIGV